MNDAVAPVHPARLASLARLARSATLSREPWFEAAHLGQRIAERLRAEAGDEAEATWGRVLHFLSQHWTRAQLLGSAAAQRPLDVLSHALNLNDDERTLLLLAGMADAHEGYGAAFAALHPRGESRPTWGLFCWLVAQDIRRQSTQQLLHGSVLFQHGLLRLLGDGPLPERSLRLTDGLWSALNGLPAWPAGVAPLLNRTAELDDWLLQPATRQALALLAGAAPATVVLRGLQDGVLRMRAQQLAAAVQGLVFNWPADAQASTANAPNAVNGPHEVNALTALTGLLAQCLVNKTVPMLLLAAPLSAAQTAVLEGWPCAIVLAGASPAALAATTRTLCVLDAAPLSATAQARLWARVLPELAPHGALLTARYAVGPDTLQQLRLDLTPWLDEGALPPLERCIAALKARTTRSDDSFARRVLPTATWADLVLPPAREAALRGTVQRLQLQQQVLDDWGFARQQRCVRGLRLLFSGLPGTGKTLAAEVLAHALHADLLVIDLARLVSKWIGETEKNLAAAFDEAEGTGTVLFFDEADALFGKRTEVSDAHDRYANIESSYLLARLERFDGVAILATNLRGNLDQAFLRRFELALEFSEPGPLERAAIWRAQFPATAPLAGDVDIDTLAALHSLPGALIRNAALGAAFLAAGEGRSIGMAHIEKALQQEYEKTGRVSPH